MHLDLTRVNPAAPLSSRLAAGRRIVAQMVNDDEAGAGAFRNGTAAEVQQAARERLEEREAAAATTILITRQERERRFKEWSLLEKVKFWKDSLPA